jgi:antitoxin VapB
MVYIKVEGLQMGAPAKVRVFMNGRSQAVRIPAEFRFSTDEVYVRQDPQTGDLILSESPSSWQEIFAALDEANFPPEFMADRQQGEHEDREPL